MKALYKVTFNETYKNLCENAGLKYFESIWFVAEEGEKEWLFSETFVEEMKVFTDHQISLDELPDEVRKDVLETLTVFNTCYVTFYDGRFHSAAGFGIMASYPTDWFVVGDYHAEDVYTKEERWEHERTLANQKFF